MESFQQVGDLGVYPGQLRQDQAVRENMPVNDNIKPAVGGIFHTTLYQIFQLLLVSANSREEQEADTENYTRSENPQGSQGEAPKSCSLSLL